MSTPRSPSSPTDGAAGAFVAHALGRPWKAHQRDTADLIGERNADGTYRRPIVVLLFPRQTGKTTFVLDLALGRCLRYADYRCAYTAQTGMMASQRFADRAAALARSPLAGVVKLYRGAGKERMTLGAGSFVRAFPPRDGALRGETLDLVVVDEAQEVGSADGAALDQTIVPTMTTRPRRQLILVGTAGDADSTFLRSYLDRGRAAVDDPDAGIAVVEYGFPEVDELDATDEALWHAWHPGLITGLADVGALRAGLAALGPAGFAREYGNVWQTAAVRVIPAAQWAACRRVRSSSTAGGRVTFGAEVALDRDSAAVLACWDDLDGTPVLEVVDERAGTPDWVAGRLADLRAGHAGDVWLNPVGPTASVAADLTPTAGRPDWLHLLTGREYVAACAGFVDRVAAGTVGHRAELVLDQAVDAAGRRPLGDAWVWAQRAAAGNIAPLIAGTVALYGATRTTPAPVRPAAYAE